MLIFLTVVAIIILLIIQFFIACEFEEIATEKGFYEKTYFWWTFLLGIVGMLMVIALPDRNIKEQEK